MADAKAQKEDMESKLAELQSINKDEFRTPGFAIGICCATLEVVMNKCRTSLDLDVAGNVCQTNGKTSKQGKPNSIAIPCYLDSRRQGGLDWEFGNEF